MTKEEFKKLLEIENKVHAYDRNYHKDYDLELVGLEYFKIRDILVAEKSKLPEGAKYFSDCTLVNNELKLV